MQQKFDVGLKTGGLTLRISLLTIFVLLYFCDGSIMTFANLLNINTYVLSLVIGFLWLAMLIVYSIRDLRNICFDGIVLVLLAMLFFYVTKLLNPEYAVIYKNAFNNGRFSVRSVFRFGAAIYAYYHIRLFANKREKLYDIFCLLPYLLFFLNIWTFIFDRTQGYDMDFGYQMELAAILFIAQYLYDKNKKRRLPLILSIICMVVTLLYGARASILGYGIFVFLYFLWDHRMTRQKAIIFVIGLAAILIITSKSAMLMIYNLCLSMGLKSRTLERFIVGSLSVDASRQDMIWPRLIEVIGDTSFFHMYGAYGDRQFVPTRFTYAHNIILEILLTFGKFFGICIICWITYKLIKVCLTNKDSNGLLTLAFGTFSICRLMFSSSFWYEPYFWALLAMLVNCSKGKRIKFKHNTAVLTAGTRPHH